MWVATIYSPRLHMLRYVSMHSAMAWWIVGHPFALQMCWTNYLPGKAARAWLRSAPLNRWSLIRDHPMVTPANHSRSAELTSYFYVNLPSCFGQTTVAYGVVRFNPMAMHYCYLTAFKNSCYSSAFVRDCAYSRKRSGAYGVKVYGKFPDVRL